MKDESYKTVTLKRPPWSGDQVRPWVRAMAWFFLICAAFAFVAATVFIVLDGGIPRQYWLTGSVFAIGELYFMAIVAHVAIRGRASKTWVPWQ
jgi:hypothetical protein